MNKIRDFIDKNHSLLLLSAQVLFSVSIALGAIFYTYANVIVYRLWKIILIDLDFALCCGALFALVYYERHPQEKVIYYLFPFLVGGGIFCGIFFGAQAILDLYVNRTVSCVVGISVTLSFDLACVIAQDFFAIKRTRKYPLWATAVLALFIYIGSLVLSFVTMPHGWLFKRFSEEEHTFSSASAEAYSVTDADRALVTDWMEKHLTGESIDPAFDFSLGGKRYRENLSDWTLRNNDYFPNGSGATFERVLYHEKEEVIVRVIGAYYAETATVEWKLEARNDGVKNSAVLSDFYPLDCALDIFSPTLYFSGGSNERNDDFALYTRELTSHPYTFDTVKGRTSKLYLPFFNVVGAEKGATIGIGWSGEWTAKFASSKDTSVQVGQSELSGYLEPSESVRTPLVSLCLYGGNHPLKGFNNFRADIKRGLPDRYKDGEANSFMFFAGAEGQDNMSRAGAAGTKEFIAELERTGAIAYLDYAWYDASWYDLGESEDWRDAIGDWAVDLKKYPDGFKAVSDYLAEKGVGALLWYEPERVPKKSYLAQGTLLDYAKSEWMIAVDGKDNYLWNMGNADARRFMTERILSSLKENGVKYYRQDFNIDPGVYWQEADRSIYGGRTGFAENHYVVGEYLFLDALLAEGYLIDNCASGGRRIDLEMCRRSVPLWRSDYACREKITDLSEASQYEQYGLGLWLPYSATTDSHASDEYALRSLLGGCVLVAADLMFEIGDDFVKFFKDYESIRAYFSENYYPLTSCTTRSSFVAMQYGTAEEGVILLYSREGSKRTKQIVMNGLTKAGSYSLATIEGEKIVTDKGEVLLSKGFSFDVKEKEAYIIRYKKD